MSAYKVISVVKGYKEATNIIKVLSVLNHAFPNLSDVISNLIPLFEKGGLSVINFKNALGSIRKTIAKHPFAALTAGIAAASVALKIYRKSQEKYQENLQKTISTADENIKKYSDEKNTLLSLQSQLEESKNDKVKLLSIQEKLNNAIGKTPGLVQGESGAYENASTKIKARIQELDDLAKKEAENKINAQKEVFKSHTTDYEFGIDNIIKVGLDIDIKNASDELERLKTERQSLIDAGAKEGAYGLNQYDKIIGRYTEILQGKAKEAQDIFSSFIDNQFDDDIGKSYVNKYIEDLIFGGEDDLENIKDKINDLKPKIDNFNQLKNDLIDYQVKNKKPDSIVSQMQDIIDELEKETPKLAEAMKTSLNSLFPDEKAIEDRFEFIKKAFITFVNNDSSKITSFNNWIDTLSEEDKNILYKISYDVDISEYSLENWKEALNDYKKNVNSIPIRNRISSLWNSETFKEVKEELLKMAGAADGISPKKIEELAKESSALSSILEENGMNAEFLASIFQNMSLGNDGLSLITDDALKLNEALIGIASRFPEITEAISKYNSAIESPEKDDEFKTFSDAFNKIDEEFQKGFTGSNQFWASAELLLGEDYLEKVGWKDGIDEIYNSMKSIVGIFEEGDDAALGFVEKLYNISKKGVIKDNDGTILAEIKKLSNGSYDVDINNLKLDALAKKMNMSKEATLACVKALGMYGDFNYYDINEVSKAIKDIGISVEYAERSVINKSKLTQYLQDLGYNKSDIHEITSDLSKLGNISFINFDAKNTQDLNEVIANLKELKLLTEEDNDIVIKLADTTSLLASIGATKEEAIGLIEKLDGLNNLSFEVGNEKLKDLGDNAGAIIDKITQDKNISWADSFQDIADVAKSTEKSVKNIETAITSLSDGSITITINTKPDSLISKILKLVGLDGKMDITLDTKTKAYSTKQGNTITTTDGNGKKYKSSVQGANRHAAGTKNAKNETAFVGEEGAELWQTKDGVRLVGVERPEFIHTRKGDVIYNAEETKKILKSKKYSGFIRRFSEGTIGGTYGAIGNKSNGSKSSKGSTSSNSKSNSSDDKIDSFDWIEIKISRLERIIDRLATKAESASKTTTEKINAVGKQISYVTKEINIQNQAYDAYMQKANSINLSDNLKKAVRDGTIKISEYKSETQDIIQEYQKWYEKALDCSDAIQQLNENLADLYMNQFNYIQENYDNKMDLVDHLVTSYETGIDELTAKGYLQSTKYYTSLQNAEKKRLTFLNEELSKLREQFSIAMDSGEIKKGSQDWYDMQLAIHSVNEEIQSANVALLEYSQTLREIEWENFDYMQDSISKLNDEADFMIDLLSYSELFDEETGAITDEGLAVMGLHGQKYNTYMHQADKYAAQVKEIQSLMASNPYDTTLIEQREEYLKLQRECILSAEEEKKAMLELVQDGIQEQEDAMGGLIDKYKEALDSEKDLYEYQRNIAKKTSEITSIKKQLSAYENDSSEETKAKIQKLKVDLEEAENDLRESEYDRYVTTTKKLLDDFYSQYQETLNQNIETVNFEIDEVIATINSNSDNINDTLHEYGDSVGYTITDGMRSIWNDSIIDTLAVYDENFDSQMTSVNTTLGLISDNVASMVKESDKTATETIKNTSITNKPTTTTKSSTTKTNTKTTTSTKTTQTSSSGTIAVGKKINAGSALIYDYKGDTSGEKQYYRKDPIYTVIKQDGGWLQVRHHKKSSGITGWFKKSDVKAYKTGGLVDYTGLAQLDGTPRKPELVLNAEDTKNFLELKEVLREMSEQPLTIRGSVPNSALYDSLSHLGGILDVSESLSKLKNSSYSQNQSVSFGDTIINIDHVQNYEDFVTKLQKDPKFEKMMESMTINKLSGGSSLAKNKYKWS